MKRPASRNNEGNGGDRRKRMFGDRVAPRGLGALPRELCSPEPDPANHYLVACECCNKRATTDELVAAVRDLLSGCGR